MRMFVLAAAVMAAGVMYCGPTAAHAQNINCTSTVGSGSSVTTINGNVTVPSGASCTLTFVNVSGNVLVQTGGSLLVSAYIEPSTIGGSVQGTNCASLLLEGNVTVTGNVQIQGCIGAGPIGFQGPGVVIGGNFLCQSNAGPCEAWLGKIADNAQILSNTGAASDVSLNTVGGNLQCQSNAAPTTHNHGYNWVTASTVGECATNFSTTSTSIGVPASSGMTCAALASLAPSGFPVPNVTITSATSSAATSSLPARCIVNGSYNVHVSPINGCTLRDNFQVQLPLPGAWNNRFFMQAANSGSLSAATGANSGSGQPALITAGYAVADDDEGTLTSDMSACGDGDQYQYFEDPGAVISEAYQTQVVTALMAKYLIATYYGQNANRSYEGGCSGGGREAMMWTQVLPQYFDAVFAGDPGPDHETSEPSQLWETEQWLNVYNTAEPPLTPATPATVPNPDPNLAPEAILYPAFPLADQQLFDTALLQFCDSLDGVADGVIDNSPLCNATFDPAAASYISGGVTYSLQCSGTKNATCLSPAQIHALKASNQGPLTAEGNPIFAPEGAVAPNHSDNRIFGYLYDAGWGTSSGLFQQGVGSSATTPSGSLSSIKFFVWADITPINPSYSPLNFNYNTNLGILTPSSPDSTVATSLDISQYVNYGHKIIYYHSTGDPQIPVLDAISYYNGMVSQFGGLEAAQSFSRLYLIPNMGHCSGGPATDQFDMTTPLVNWVENGIAPGPIPAKGVNFTTAQYQVGFVAGAPDNAPTTRNRPLCPYPQEARFIGSTTPDPNGFPVASNPADLAVASNYQCVVPSGPNFLAIGVDDSAAIPRTQISAISSGLSYSRVSQTFVGTVTITNTSSDDISGPLQILFTGIPASVTLVNANGTSSGSPYLTVPGVNSLAPGQSITVSVQFKNPSNVVLNATPVVYTGSL